MHRILMPYAFNHFVRLIWIPRQRLIFLITQQFTIDILGHSHLVWRIYNAIATQYLAQILRFIIKRSILWQTKLQRIIFIWKLCSCTGHFDRFHIDDLAFDKFNRCHTRYIECM